MYYVVKAAIAAPNDKWFSLHAKKAMYSGKNIRPQDTVFVFSSENAGGEGLIARGIAPWVTQPRLKRKNGQVRITHRVSITVRRVAKAKRRLGRPELKLFPQWDDGRPETELCFKFYRQATNKIARISAHTAAFLRTFF